MTSDPILEPPHGGEGWRGEIAATLGLAWPLVVANLAQMLVYAVDVIFVARLGAETLAASSLAVSLFGLVAWSLSGMTGMVAALQAVVIMRGYSRICGETSEDTHTGTPSARRRWSATSRSLAGLA